MALLQIESRSGTGRVRGILAATTVGTRQDYRRQYFSLLGDEDQQEVEQRAKRLEREWRREAEKVKKANKLRASSVGGSLCPDLPSGIKGYIFAIKSTRGGRTATTAKPCFVVRYKKSKSKRFSIGKLGYKEAWEQAASFFSSKNGLGKIESRRLKKMQPPVELFLGTLRENYEARGHALPRQTLEEMIRSA